MFLRVRRSDADADGDGGGKVAAVVESNVVKNWGWIVVVLEGGHGRLEGVTHGREGTSAQASI